MFKKIYWGTLIAGLFLLGMAANLWAFAIAVDPARINLEAAPGGKITGEIKISNNATDQKQGFLAYCEDFVFNKEGSKEVRPIGSTLRSAANWVTLAPTEFEVNPNGSKKIKFTINVPPDARGGYYCLVFFETALPKTQASFTGAALKGRIGATLSLTVKGTADPKGVITKITTTRPDEDKPLYTTISFENQGNVVLWGKGVLQISDASGTVYSKTDFENFNTLPGDVMERTFDWSGKLDAGKYSASVTIDYGTPNPTFSETSFEVKKEWDIEKISPVLSRTRTSKIYLKVANTGNLNIEPEGEVKIINGKGVLVDTLKVEKSFVLPNSAKVLTAISAKKLVRGNYKVTADVKVAEEVKTKEVSFVVK